jgi:predicted nucleic acid-binding protein
VRVLVDTNVVLDLINQRQPFFADSYAAVQLALEKCSPYVSAITVTDSVYITRKVFPDSINQKKALENFFSQFRICPVKRNQLKKAFSSAMPDFEDAVQAFCGKHDRVSYIITRNVKDYNLSPIKALTPADFIDLMKN